MSNINSSYGLHDSAPFIESEDSLPYSQKSTLDRILGQMNPFHRAPIPFI